MMVSSVYTLPALVGEQYMFTSVLKESADTVLYAASQKDMRRDVVVESLRPEAARDPLRVQAFLDSAKAQARLGGAHIASALELLYADETWHLAKERIKGDSLDSMLASGRKLASSDVCELMLSLCHICLCMDMEGIASVPFSLQSVYAVGIEFRFDNPATGGGRDCSTSRRTLSEAARQIAPLLDPASPRAGQVRELLRRMELTVNWSALSPLLFDEDFVRLQMQILQEQAPLAGAGA